MNIKSHPKLRDVDIQNIMYEGQPFVVLRDPKGLSGKSLFVPRGLAPVLGLMDGTRDLRGLQNSLILRFGLKVPEGTLEELIVGLDDALLLENGRFIRANRRAAQEYRQAPHRFPNMAGASYPGEPRELREHLEGYLKAMVEIKSIEKTQSPKLRGLVSPHIDYARGGPVYARVWKRAAEGLREADLIVVLGTDHFGETHKPFTLTKQHYATPYGVLPTSQEVVGELARAIGEEYAFEDELRHLGEHSIELAAVWLHHILGGDSCEVVPILCGSFLPYMLSGNDPRDDPIIQDFLSAYHQATRSRRVVVVAAGDLAHVGPAFGGNPLDIAARARVKAADESLIERICAGDARGFYEEIRRVEDRNNVCGLAPIYAPIYMALRMLEPVQGEDVAYDRCPADSANTSFVSVCGVLFW